MEEIDIIELLERVKENKAPKIIEINKKIYKFNYNPPDICKAYIRNEDGYPYLWLTNENITFNTKIKILDKPIIEELPKWITRRDEEVTQSEGKRLEMADKINEIIKWINNKK